MDHQDCIFCKIINGEMPSAKVYEDEHVYAFLDISQVTKGHTLVIPKKHTKDLYDTPPEVAGELFARIPRIANAIKETYQPVGINLLNNNEKGAGQVIFHLHIHIIPRYEDDGFSFKGENHTDEYSLENLQQMAKEISKELSDN
ncbi:HIT family protein [Virgibacillus alimentarius]|uniref:Histidine triad (HIT) family protein n=1 Tax=Virgibacillus alimentarius TaxID=698769 RepID=A0ABS4SBD4_9BACI|nr:HIT family protein [Virgibacillus alimentarius]MBP2258833.1 histidine triad (HIT) family protein [Virgibacillus alimentarius]